MYVICFMAFNLSPKPVSNPMVKLDTVKGICVCGDFVSVNINYLKHLAKSMLYPLVLLCYISESLA